MSELAEEISTPIQEKSVPEINLIEKLDRLFYAVGKLTKPSRFSRSAEIPEGLERSLLSRTTRADLLAKLEAIPKSNRVRRQETIREAKVRDEIARQYLNQGEVRVNLPGLEEQTARFVIIEPPKSLVPQETETKPTIFLIPGISNDIDSVTGLVQEIAFLGRKVIVVGFPESYMGKISPEFVEAVRKSQNYEPHTTFFKRAVVKLLGPASNIELWGFSTGAPIVAEILSDQEFQKRTTNAVLLSPASSVDQSRLQLNLGIAQEVARLVKNFGKLAKYSLTSGRKTPDEKGQKQLKQNVYKSLLDKVRRKSDFWRTMKVQDTGQIVIVSGKRDQMTKSSEAISQFAQNPQGKIVDFPDGSHVTPLVEPEKVLPKVF